MDYSRRSGSTFFALLLAAVLSACSSTYHVPTLRPLEASDLELSAELNAHGPLSEEQATRLLEAGRVGEAETYAAAAARRARARWALAVLNGTDQGPARQAFRRAQAVELAVCEKTGGLPTELSPPPEAGSDLRKRLVRYLRTLKGSYPQPVIAALDPASWPVELEQFLIASDLDPADAARSGSLTYGANHPSGSFNDQAVNAGLEYDPWDPELLVRSVLNANGWDAHKLPRRQRAALPSKLSTAGRAVMAYRLLGAEHLGLALSILDGLKPDGSTTGRLIKIVRFLALLGAGDQGAWRQAPRDWHDSFGLALVVTWTAHRATDRDRGAKALAEMGRVSSIRPLLDTSASDVDTWVKSLAPALSRTRPIARACLRGHLSREKCRRLQSGVGRPWPGMAADLWFDLTENNRIAPDPMWFNLDQSHADWRDLLPLLQTQLGASGHLAEAVTVEALRHGDTQRAQAVFLAHHQHMRPQAALVLGLLISKPLPVSQLEKRWDDIRSLIALLAGPDARMSFDREGSLGVGDHLLAAIYSTGAKREAALKQILAAPAQPLRDAMAPYLTSVTNGLSGSDTAPSDELGHAVALLSQKTATVRDRLAWTARWGTAGAPDLDLASALVLESKTFSTLDDAAARQLVLLLRPAPEHVRYARGTLSRAGLNAITKYDYDAFPKLPAKDRVLPDGITHIGHVLLRKSVERSRAIAKAYAESPDYRFGADSDLDLLVDDPKRPIASSPDNTWLTRIQAYRRAGGSYEGLHALARAITRSDRLKTILKYVPPGPLQDDMVCAHEVQDENYDSALRRCVSAWEHDQLTPSTLQGMAWLAENSAKALREAGYDAQAVLQAVVKTGRPGREYACAVIAKRLLGVGNFEGAAPYVACGVRGPIATGQFEFASLLRTLPYVDVDIVQQAAAFVDQDSEYAGTIGRAFMAAFAGLAQAAVTELGIGGKSLERFEPPTRLRFAQFSDLMHLLADDVRRGHLNRRSAAQAFTLLESAAGDELAALKSAHPNSCALNGDAGPPSAAPLRKACRARHPHNFRLWSPHLMAGSPSDRRAFLKRAGSHRIPGDPRWSILTPETSPTPATAGTEVKPFGAMKSARTFDAWIGGATFDEPYNRYYGPMQAQGALLPDRFTLTGGQERFRAESRGVRVSFFVEASPATCAPQACFKNLVSQFGKETRVLWSRKTRVVQGPAWEASVETGGISTYLLTFPIGRRVHTAMVILGTEDPDSAGPLIARLRQSFAASDLVVRADIAEKLRERSPLSVADTVLNRTAARPSDKGCPLPKELKTTPEAWLDAWLDTHSAAQRRALATCVRPHQAPFGLGVLALTDDDPVVHRLGEAIASARPSQVAAATRTVLMAPPDPDIPLARPNDQTDLPPVGVLQVLVALPAPQQKDLVEELLAAKDEGKRLAAWIASRFAPKSLSDDRRAEALRTGSTAVANAIAVGLPAKHSPVVHRALLARTESELAKKAPNYGLLLTLYWRLVSSLDRASLPALRKMDKYFHDRLGQRGESLSDVVEGGAAALAAGTLPTIEGPWAEVTRYFVQQHLPERTAAPVEVLKNAPLPRLVAGSEWSYTRIDGVDTLRAQLSELWRRLKSTTASGTVTLQRIVAFEARQRGFGIFADGIDGSRPVECLRSKNQYLAFVCSAYVKDPDAVRRVLFRRQMGRDSGLAAPMALEDIAGAAEWFADKPGEIDYYQSRPRRGGGGGRTEGETVLTERLRFDRTVAGQRVQHMVLIKVSEDGEMGYDREEYVLIGDRLFMTGSEVQMDNLLTGLPAERDSFARHPGVKALNSRIKGRPGIYGIYGYGALGLEDEVWLSATIEGPSIRVSGGVSAPKRRVDTRQLLALLPPGDSLAWSKNKAVPPKDAKLPPPAAPVTADRPPAWVARTTHSLAWYPDPKDGLIWSNWVAIVRRDDAKPLLKGTPWTWPTRAPAKLGGVHYAATGDALVLSSDRKLLDQAVARDRRSRRSRARQYSFSRVDAARYGTALRALSRHKSQRGWAGALGWFATLSDAFVDMRTRWSWSRGRTASFQSELRLSQSDTPVPTELVARAVDTKTIRNSLKLPRPIPGNLFGESVTLVLKVDDAARVAERLGGGVRTKVKALDATSVEIKVLPGPAHTEKGVGGALNPGERTRALANTSDIRWDRPEIVALAQGLAPKGTSKRDAVKNVLDWVGENLTYELDGRARSAADVIKRQRGDCTEYSTLVAALLRAVGIPAELRSGMLLVGDSIGAHAWVAWHDGEGWHELEPTAASTRVGASHIEVEIGELMSLVDVDGVEIIAADVKPYPAPTVPSR